MKRLSFILLLIWSQTMIAQVTPCAVFDSKNYPDSVAKVEITANSREVHKADTVTAELFGSTVYHFDRKRGLDRMEECDEEGNIYSGYVWVYDPVLRTLTQMELPDTSEIRKITWYDSLGRVAKTKLFLGGGSITQYEYGKGNLLVRDIEIQYAKDSITIESKKECTYDSLGRPTISRYYAVRGKDLVLATTQWYTYDSVGNLTELNWQQDESDEIYSRKWKYQNGLVIEEENSVNKGSLKSDYWNLSVYRYDIHGNLIFESNKNKYNMVERHYQIQYQEGLPVRCLYTEVWTNDGKGQDDYELHEYVWKYTFRN